ncbi:MAG: acyl-CoA dehydrogenase family protein [Acidimicrobiales bacterium]
MTTDLSALLNDVRDFRVREVDPHIARWEHERTMAPHALREAARLGLLAMEVPVELGGLGLTFSEKLRVIDVLCETSMPFAFSLVNTANTSTKIAIDGAESHRGRFLSDLMSGRRLGSTALTEPGAGSDFAAISMRAERVDGGWKLNGSKAWITNAALSDVIIMYAQTDPSAGGNGIASFLIDGTQPGFVRTEPYALLGGHLIGAGGFDLVDYFAPDDDLFAPAGVAFKSALGGINGARTYVASMCCAMIEASLRIAVTYGAKRHAFGKPIIEHQGLAWSLAKVANQLEAARLLTTQAELAVESGDSRAAILPAAHAKKFASEVAEPCIAACIQAMGAEGLKDEYPLGRHLAAARIANYVDGSTEIQSDRIAASLVRIYAN